MAFKVGTKGIIINESELTVYAISAAMNVAEVENTLTPEARTRIEKLADSYAKALSEGRALIPQPDGSYLIGSKDDAIGLREEAEKILFGGTVLEIGGE